MYFRKRPIFLAKSMPYFRMQDRSTGGNPAFLLSIPSMNRMINPFMSINQSRYESLFVKFNNPTDRNAVQNFINDCKSNFNGN